MPSIYPYPLDLTGGVVSNRVVNEVHVINNATERAFVLQGGTFFTQGLQVKNSNGGALLQPHTQFIAAHLNREASGLTGLETCGVIFITDPAITSVTVTYHAVGGQYCDLTPLALTLLSNMASGGIPVSWAQVVGEPEKYPPAPHRHHADTIYGLGEVVNVLEGIRQAITIGHGPVIAAVYHYLDQMTANLRANFDEQISGIDITPASVVYATLAEVYSGEVGRVVGSDVLKQRLAEGSALYTDLFLPTGTHFFTIAPGQSKTVYLCGAGGGAGDVRPTGLTSYPYAPPGEGTYLYLMTDGTTGQQIVRARPFLSAYGGGGGQCGDASDAGNGGYAGGWSHQFGIDVLFSNNGLYGPSGTVGTSTDGAMGRGPNKIGGGAPAGPNQGPGGSGGMVSTVLTNNSTHTLQYMIIVGRAGTNYGGYYPGDPLALISDRHGYAKVLNGIVTIQDVDFPNI